METHEAPSLPSGPCCRDPVRWATQVALLVLLSPALLVALLVGVLGIGVMAAARVPGWSPARVRAGIRPIAPGPIARRPAPPVGSPWMAGSGARARG